VSAEFLCFRRFIAGRAWISLLCRTRKWLSINARRPFFIDSTGPNALPRAAATRKGGPQHPGELRRKNPDFLPEIESAMSDQRQIHRGRRVHRKRDSRQSRSVQRPPARHLAARSRACFEPSSAGMDPEKSQSRARGVERRQANFRPLTDHPVIDAAPGSAQNSRPMKTLAMTSSEASVSPNRTAVCR